MAVLNKKKRTPKWEAQKVGGYNKVCAVRATVIIIHHALFHVWTVIQKTVFFMLT
jgi:hypothetical protein